MNPILPTEHLTLIFLALLGISGWSAWCTSARCRGLARIAVPALRIGSVLGLAVLAFNPGRWVTTTEEQPGEWAVLVDASASMDTRDTSDQSRWEQAWKLTERIEKSADKEQPVQWFRFDTNLQAIARPKDLEHFSPRGEKTDIIESGTQLLDRYQTSQRRLLGTILLTDGRQIPPRSATELTVKARTQNSPLYPLVLGAARQQPDLSITTRRRQFLAFQGQPLTISARLQAEHLKQVRPVVKLIDDAGKVAEEKTVSVSDEPFTDLRFELRAETPGYRQHRVQVAPWTGESSTANNTAEFGVWVLPTPVRILLVEGTPYWDSKFIAQLLQRQKNVELTLIYRLTTEKYFSVESASTNSGKGIAQLKAFPDTAEALARYDVVMVGKGFEYFLNPERIALLQDFVRERGGGLVFARGKPYTGELPALEPLEPMAWDQPWTGDFSWQPTALGEESGLFTDRLPGRESPVWSRLPTLSHAVQGSRRKAFTQVHAEGVAKLGEQSVRLPVVVSQRYGKGLVVAVNSDDLWQWDFFPRFEGASQIYQDFWLQLVNWSVMYSDFLPGYDWSLRLSDQSVEAGRSVRVQVAHRHQSTSAAAPLIRLFLGERQVRELYPAATGERSDAWEGIFTLERPGTYHVELVTEAGHPLYETLHVKAPPNERENVSPDQPWLEQIAKETDGRMITEADLAELLRPKPVMESATAQGDARWVSRWDRGPWLLLLTALLGTEWFLRRRNGLT